MAAAAPIMIQAAAPIMIKAAATIRHPWGCSCHHPKSGLLASRSCRPRSQGHGHRANSHVSAQAACCWSSRLTRASSSAGQRQCSLCNGRRRFKRSYMLYKQDVYTT
eukprot:364971-Chlamydomonas_euryale.AAC.10